ncbi:hypothetical protein RCC89_12880 [Cytophagaceae bacterium ABcell3]|nr:hypothetical protein RCC89_12880 [Cytophagaceae bacterium ABcell3]
MLERELIPIYYANKSKWVSIMKAGAKDVAPEFDSSRMAKEYYDKLYNYLDQN